MEDFVLFAVFVVSVLAIGIGMLAMAIGVIGSGRCLRGSCGGPERSDAQGQRVTCAGCPHRHEAA